MFWKILPARAFLVGLFLVAGLGLVFYLVVFRVAESSVTQQMFSKQQMLVKAEASNISSFFQVFGNSIAVLAQSANETGDMDAFVEQWRDSGIVGGVVLTDSQGIVQFNSNILGTKDVGASVADRDYFSWAKTNPQEGQYFIGQPVISRMGPTKGQTIVPVASPVYESTHDLTVGVSSLDRTSSDSGKPTTLQSGFYRDKNGVLTGVLVASVKVRPLTQNYLELMKVSDVTEVYLISKQGELLYGNFLPDDATGMNIFQFLKENPFSGSQILSNELKNALTMTREGSMKAAYLNPKTDKVEEHLLAYSPVSLGGQNWLLVMASPAQEITSITVPIYLRLTALIVLISLSIFLFGIVSVREIKVQKSL